MFPSYQPIPMGTLVTNPCQGCGDASRVFVPPPDDGETLGSTLADGLGLSDGNGCWSQIGRFGLYVGVGDGLGVSGLGVGGKVGSGFGGTRGSGKAGSGAAASVC